MYVTQGPQCTGKKNQSAWDGYSNQTAYITNFCNTGRGALLNGKDSYQFAQVGAVIDYSLSKFTVGAYYPTDANVIDGRCWYDPAVTPPADPYDCFQKATGTGGPGDHDGMGCHESQVDAKSPVNAVTLVMDSSCQCNAHLSGKNWEDWVDHWLAYANPQAPEVNPPWVGYTYFSGNSPSTPYYKPGGQTGKAPMFALDWSMCWVDNTKDLVRLQNAIWRARGQWWNGLVPRPPANKRSLSKAAAQPYYWGWNEVPLKKKFDNSSNWTSIVIKLLSQPADSSGRICSRLLRHSRSN
jgi:hypothetical protein